jgi:hypothetical protein
MDLNQKGGTDDYSLVPDFTENRWMHIEVACEFCITMISGYVPNLIQKFCWRHAVSLSGTTPFMGAFIIQHDLIFAKKIIEVAISVLAIF